VAARYGVTVEQIRWSNALLRRSEAVKKGDKLVVPPVPGVVVTVQPGDTVASIANKYQASPEAIINFNYLRDPEHLVTGTDLVVPNGKGPKLNAPIPGSTIANHFPWGWCTWYVASRVGIPWNGNAWEWYGAAQAYGYEVGKTPQVGSVMVNWDSYVYGHVAYVEQVNPDGSFVVSEMNYAGFGIVDRRTVVPGKGSPLIGFIYF
jgi:LysM repeat protein